MTSPDSVRLVLAAVRKIPRGKVMSYGDVAEYVGLSSPRQVGAIMRGSGGSVPWHRVVMADGRPKPVGGDEQLALLRVDRTPLTTDGQRVDMQRARWDGRSVRRSGAGAGSGGGSGRTSTGAG